MPEFRLESDAAPQGLFAARSIWPGAEEYTGNASWRRKETLMEKIALNDNLSLSRIVYGMWRLGDDSDTSPKHVQAKIEACLEQGITSMDQADIYGGYMAEEILGEALKAAPALKDQIEIVTKCDIVAPAGRYAAARVKYYDTSRAHILASVDHSLRLMGIDKIDLLLIHRPDPLMDHAETGAALDETFCFVR